MIYLDCAATSLQKPEGVWRQMHRAMKTMASPGRGGHQAAMGAADMVYDCRCTAAQLFHVPSPEQVVFTFNATHGLNIAINSLVSAGDSVAVSGYEHNSVMRPLRQIGANVHVVRSSLFDSATMVDEFAKLIPKVKTVVCTTMSNVFGYITPIEEIADLCKRYDVPLIVDASQLAGCGAIDFTRLGAAFLAAPGHKGLMGPQGTGVLLCGQVPKPLLCGGTGSDSKRVTMPEILPDVAEAGTHNVVGIAGLNAGMQFVLTRGIDKISVHERALLKRFVVKAKEIPHLKVFAAEQAAMQGGVVSVSYDGIDCEALAEMLGERGIAVRGGMHCAPEAHQTVGTYHCGTVRFSFSPFNTFAEIDRAVGELKQCTKNLTRQR